MVMVISGDLSKRGLQNNMVMVRVSPGDYMVMVSPGDVTRRIAESIVKKSRREEHLELLLPRQVGRVTGGNLMRRQILLTRSPGTYRTWRLEKLIRHILRLETMSTLRREIVMQREEEIPVLNVRRI